MFKSVDKKKKNYVILRKNAGGLEFAPFESIRKGDIFTAFGLIHICGEDAHYSGDASYDGYLLYDTDGEAFFPEDLDSVEDMLPDQPRDRR